MGFGDDRTGTRSLDVCKSTKGLDRRGNGYLRAYGEAHCLSELHDEKS